MISSNAVNAQSVYAADLDDDRDIDVLSGFTNDSKIAWGGHDASIGAGSTYVYLYDGSTWEEEAKLTSSAAEKRLRRHSGHSRARWAAARLDKAIMRVASTILVIRAAQLYGMWRLEKLPARSRKSHDIQTRAIIHLLQKYDPCRSKQLNSELDTLNLGG